ncbi:MAG: MFS transporter [Anaerolineales bacterium]|nr:MFS transporter [Anaerolineales bacterium]MCS7246690.1 MFS transporter [Anaerolineales bacterium]MDW8160500.1 MFS transporter [Anaerolineales bacterium]MDW8446185.1 MFS transporter [Anaerolineales bacterium]
MSRASLSVPRRRLAFLTLARILVNTIYRMVYPFLGVFRTALGASLEQMSWILTLRSTLGVLTPLFASIGDSRGRKAGMLVGIALFTLGCSLIWIRQTYFFFAIALLLTMLGKYIFDPSLLAYVGDQVVYSVRGRVMALMEFSWSLSFLVGVPLMGLLLKEFGWKAPFGISAVLGAVLLVGLLSLNQASPPAKSPSRWQSFRAIFSSRIALYALATGWAISAANEVINLVFGVWLEETFRFRIAALGAATAVIGLSELIGESLVAALVDRLGKPQTVSLGILLNILAAIGLAQSRSSISAVSGLFFFYVTFELTLVSSIPLVSEIFPEQRATMLSSTGASHALGRAFGALIAAPLYQMGLSANLAVAIALNLLALLALRALTQRKTL